MPDLTFINSGNSGVYYNIEARYFEPKEEFKVAEEVPNYNSMSVSDLVNHVKQKDIKDKAYWANEGITFYGKDGATDAYTKSGESEEIVEYFDRQFMNQRVWRFETNESYIDFKAGGIVRLEGDDKDWVILHVIHVFNTGTVQNRYFYLQDPSVMKRFANKILILG